MEVLLNTIWLLLAIAAFLFWQIDSEKTALQHEHTRRYRMLSLVVVLVLLFPVISLTDDLHSEQAAMEESSRAIMKARSMVQSCLRSGAAPFSAAISHGLLPGAALLPYPGAVVLFETPPRSTAPISAHDGRSPPYPS
jgi:hypothetical protein